MTPTKSATQTHVGDYNGEAIYYTDSKNRWWSGFMFHDLTAEQLFRISLSIVLDLLELYPRFNDILLSKIEIRITNKEEE